MDHILKKLYERTLATSLIDTSYTETNILEIFDTYELLQYISSMHFSEVDQKLTFQVNDYAAYEFFLLHGLYDDTTHVRFKFTPVYTPTYVTFTNVPFGATASDVIYLLIHYHPDGFDHIMADEIIAEYHDHPYATGTWKIQYIPSDTTFDLLLPDEIELNNGHRIGVYRDRWPVQHFGKQAGTHPQPLRCTSRRSDQPLSRHQLPTINIPPEHRLSRYSLPAVNIPPDTVTLVPDSSPVASAPVSNTVDIATSPIVLVPAPLLTAPLTPPILPLTPDMMLPVIPSSSSFFRTETAPTQTPLKLKAVRRKLLFTPDAGPPVIPIKRDRRFSDSSSPLSPELSNQPVSPTTHNVDISLVPATVIPHVRDQPAESTDKVAELPATILPTYNSVMDIVMLRLLYPVKSATYATLTDTLIALRFDLNEQLRSEVLNVDYNLSYAPFIRVSPLKRARDRHFAGGQMYNMYTRHILEMNV